MEKAKAEKQGRGDGAQATDPELGVQGPGFGEQSQDSSDDERSAASEQSSIDDRPSAIPDADSRTPNPHEEDELDAMEVRSRVERLIGVFLCSEAFQTFKPVQECNRRVEEAFQALERALDKVVKQEQTTAGGKQ